MKRKYYLRGLGFGILITTLVFTVLGRQELSEAEIIRRAEELGYVKADLSPAPTSMLDLDALKEQLTQTPKLTLTPQPTPEGNLDLTPEPVPEDQLTPAPEEPLAPNPTPVIGQPTLTPEPADSAENGEGAVTAVIEVTKGMTSFQVSQLLEEAGIIEDWLEFNKYMAKQKLTDYINIGKFTLSSTMEQEEIAHILTGR